MDECPLFFKDDALKLKEKMIRLVGKGKGKPILYNIEKSKLKPSKKLLDSISSIIDGNKEYMMIESQKFVYENILSKTESNNNVFIINGNPGTGKSVFRY